MNIILEAGVAIYVALGVALAVWVGIFVYLWRLDAQAQALRRKLDQQPDTAAAPAPTATLRAQRSSAEPATSSAEPAASSSLAPGEGVQQ